MTDVREYFRSLAATNENLVRADERQKVVSEIVEALREERAHVERMTDYDLADGLNHALDVLERFGAETGTER